MKKIVLNVLFICLLFSMAAANSDNKKSAKPATATAAAVVDKTASFDGWVSDDQCKEKIDAVCSRKCIAMGHKLVFVGADKTVVPVANQQSLKDFIGLHVNIKGKLENGILTVASVKAAK